MMKMTGGSLRGKRHGQIKWWAQVPPLTPPDLQPSVHCVASNSHQVQWHIYYVPTGPKLHKLYV